MSTSIHDGVIDDDGGINVLLVDDEPPGFGSTSIVIDLDDDDGTAVIPSQPPGLDSGLSTSIVIDLDGKDGIDETSREPPGHGSRLSSSIDDDIRTPPGEQHKNIRVFEIPRGFPEVCWGVTRFPCSDKISTRG